MLRRYLLLAVVCVLCACNAGVIRPTAVVESPSLVRTERLEDVLRRSPKLASLVEHAAAYRLQVLVSVVSADGTGWKRRDGFRVDAEYFYPASAIKLCNAVAALEVVSELRESEAVELDVDAVFSSDAASKRRRSSRSIAQLVGGALVMSDNEASNDLFDIAGFDGIHERMWRMGLSSFRMRHRLGVSANDDVRINPSIELASNGRPIIIPVREGRVELGKNREDGVLVGESYLAGGRLVEEPMSFEDKNRISLSDLQDLLVAVMRPELTPDRGVRLGARERSLLVDSLTALPSSRGATRARDFEHKPFLAGIERIVPRTNLTLASKSGRAYGFIVENAYIHDARTERAFFLTAAMYTNPNGRLNDDRYDYAEVAFPGFADLGEVIARFALDD